MLKLGYLYFLIRNISATYKHWYAIILVIKTKGKRVSKKIKIEVTYKKENENLIGIYTIVIYCVLMLLYIYAFKCFLNCISVYIVYKYILTNLDTLYIHKSRFNRNLCPICSITGLYLIHWACFHFVSLKWQTYQHAN